MSFQDLFVQRLSRCPGDVLAGRAAVARLLERSLSRGRLAPADLGDPAILMLESAGLPAGPLRDAVDAQFLRRRLHLRPDHAWRLWQASAPACLHEPLALGHAGGSPQRGLAHSILVDRPELLVDDLCCFLGRLYLIDPAARPLRPRAVRFVVEALSQFYQGPFAPLDFHSLLYRHVLEVLRWSDDAALRPPDAWPAPLPAWAQRLSLGERRFLDGCLQRLGPDDRVLVYLVLYAGLTLRQVAGAVSFPAEQLLDRFERCVASVV